MQDFPEEAWFPWPEKGEDPVLTVPGQAALTRAALLRKGAEISRRLRAAGIRHGHVVATLLPGGPEMVACLLGVPAVATLAPLNPSLTAAEIQASLRDLGASALITPSGIQTFSDVPEDDSLADVPLILFTSATTGKPKQVPLTFVNLQAMMDKTASGLRISAEDRLLSFMPLFHLQGILSLLVTLRAGGGVTLTPRFEAEQFASCLDQYRPTWYTAGPAIHNAILHPSLPRPPKCLRFARSSGAKLAPAILHSLEDLLEAPVVEAYGLTESGSVAQNPLPPGVRKPGSAGLPYGVEIRLQPDGEILIRGPSVMRGYRKDEPANREAFLEGWFRTGDLGCFDEDGYLYVTGRTKEMINRGGEKISPPEIDDVLSSHPLVREAAAFGLPHPTLGEDVAAAVVLQPAASVTASDLRAYAARRLAPHKVPHRIFFAGSLPRAATGKVRRHELTPAFASVQLPAVTPSNALEAELAARWRNHLGGEMPCVQTDWYALGGDSVGLARLLTELDACYGLPSGTVEESGFLAEPTVENLARCLEAPRMAAPVVRFHPGGHKPPFFCLPGIHGSPRYLQPLADSTDPDRPVFLLRFPDCEPGRAAPVEEIAARTITVIRGLQPRGPYLLGGHCYGGVVAWEIASHLEAGGETGALVLFDAAVPGYPRPLQSWRSYLNKAVSLAAVALRGQVRRVLDQSIHHFRYLQQLRRGQRYALSLLEHPGAAPATSLLTAAYARLWKPRPISWPVAVFVACGEPASTEVLEDPRLAWRAFTRGRFCALDAEGDHNGMFTAGASGFAAQLDAVLGSLLQPSGACA
jgi:acyl-CoA synthetase (AMP-forming)/AMP-acid ligase II/thioesterase domain-containing protein